MEHLKHFATREAAILKILSNPNRLGTQLLLVLLFMIIFNAEMTLQQNAIFVSTTLAVTWAIVTRWLDCFLDFAIF